MTVAQKIDYEVTDFEARILKSNGEGLWLKNKIVEDFKIDLTLSEIEKDIKNITKDDKICKEYQIFGNTLSIVISKTTVLSLKWEYLSRTETYHRFYDNGKIDENSMIDSLKTEILRINNSVISKEREEKKTKNYIALDASPYIMSRIREMFPQAKNAPSSGSAIGKYTHRPLILPLNMMTAKEVSWLMMRYVFDVSEELLSEISSLTKQYDDLQRNKKNILNNKSNIEFLTPNNFLKLNPEITPEQHQLVFENFVYNVSQRCLLADPMGLGKTLSCSLLFRNPVNLPAILVAKPTLIYQHAKELQMYYPDMKIQIIRGKNNYEIKDDVNLVVISYNLLQYWEDYLIANFNYQTIIFDEVSELRSLDTKKRISSSSLSKKAKISIGADGYPVWNLGSDIWSIIDVLSPDALGSHDEFKKEWCDFNGSVVEPTLLNTYLKNKGLMVRRTHEEANRKKDVVYSNVCYLETPTTYDSQNYLKSLSLALLNGNVGSDEYNESVSQYDFKMRMEAGKLKAGPVAEFTRQVANENGKVILCGWHHEVYDKWREMLSDLQPAFITGNESPSEKEVEKNRFIEDENCKVIIISLRSGAGFNGLQHVCNNIVFGELDWTNASHEQLITRLARWGQTKPVYAYYMVLNSLSDPFIVQRLDLKRSQYYGIVEGKESEIKFTDSDSKNASLDKLREMAKEYLLSIDEEVPESFEMDGILGDVSSVLNQIQVSTSNEEALQRNLFDLLSEKLPLLKIEREVKISKKSRVDFMIENNNGETLVIECKATTKNRADAIRQVRRYIQELNPTAVILYVPWANSYNFKVDGVPVVINSYSSKSL